MPQRSTITAIERSKKSKHRYHVYLDDAFAFSVHEDVLVKHRLAKGQVLDEDERQMIAIDEEHNQAFQQALKIISARDRSTFEIKQRLTQKQFTPEAITAAVQKLKSLQLLDDRAYAERVVQYRLNTQKKGRRWIVHELKEKGISDQDIDHALHQIDDEGEWDAAMSLARKRWNPGSTEEEYIRNHRRVGDYLLRRGFSPSLVQQVLRRITEESPSS